MISKPLLARIPGFIIFIILTIVNVGVILVAYNFYVVTEIPNPFYVLLCLVSFSALASYALVAQGSSFIKPPIKAVEPVRCQAGNDGDCTWDHCPQLRDKEPVNTGRSCPLSVAFPNDEEY